MNDTAYYRLNSSAANKAAWALRRSFFGRTAAPLVAQLVYYSMKIIPNPILKHRSVRRLGEIAQLWAVLDPRAAAIPIGFGPLRGFSIFNDPSPHFPTFRALGIEEVMNWVLFERAIGPGDVSYDIGANEGLHTLLLSRLCGSKGRVYAFEPWPENLEKLRANLQLNNVTNVEIEPCAVSRHSGFANFRAGPDSSQGRLVDDATQDAPHPDLEVSTTCLDDFVAQAGRLPPTLLKIDIEGGEGEAMRGACRVLHEFRPVVICEIHGEAAGEVVQAVLAEAGYKCFVLETGFRTVHAEESLPQWCHLWACHPGETNRLASLSAVRSAA
jgi:FkbM family methyltransferase